LINNPWGSGETEFFYQLTPDLVLDYIDKIGFKTTGRCLPLNSMENRGPGRRSREQILEEHEFLFDLQNIDIPVIAPLTFDNESLFEMSEQKLYYCVFPKRGGRNPDELSKEQVEQVGRLMGRLHYAGARKSADHRIQLNPITYGENNLSYFLTTDMIPAQFKDAYQKLGKQFIDLIEPKFQHTKMQRIHGDCHWGNLLYSEQDGFFFIDFDDMVMGPVVQDLWLLLPGRDQEAIDKRNLFIEGYEQWNDFPMDQMQLIEPLRGLRYLHFDAWIARRYADPAFQVAFPYFTEERYWAERLQDLREQIELSQYSWP